MRAKKSPQVIKIERTAPLRLISGSDCEEFTNVLVAQVGNSLWLKNSDPEERARQIDAVITSMVGMKPRDELEGMLIAQLIASHNAAMECYRRAMLAEQSFEARRENLNQAHKLSRTYAALTDALDRHRGKGQQRITVEHVNVHAGGQAIVGAVSPGDGSGRPVWVPPTIMAGPRRCGQPGEGATYLRATAPFSWGCFP